MTDAEREREIAAIKRNVDRSYEQDAARARLSYTEHTATALHRRAIAGTNGRAQYGCERCRHAHHEPGRCGVNVGTGYHGPVLCRCGAGDGG